MFCSHLPKDSIILYLDKGQTTEFIIRQVLSGVHSCALLAYGRVLFIKENRPTFTAGNVVNSIITGTYEVCRLLTMATPITTTTTLLGPVALVHTVNDSIL